MKHLILIYMMVGALTSCSIIKRESTFVCVSIPAVESYLESDSVFKVADPSVVSVSGKIVDIESEEMAYALVGLFDTDSVKIMEVSTNLNGEFLFFTEPGEYLLSFSSVSYSTLIYEINLSRGETREVVVVMGEASGFATVKPRRHK